MKVACALILNRKKILIAKRPASKANGNKWEFPGGKLEEGESSETALLRELNEELQIRCSPEKLLPLGEVCHLDIQLTSFLLPYQEPLCPTEHSALAWVKLEHLHAFDLCKSDKKTLEAFSEAILKHLDTC